MSTTLREYRDEDHEQVAMVLSTAFNSGEPYAPDSKLPGDEEDAEAFVAEAHGRIVGAFAIRYTPMTCRGRLIKCGGISSVGVGVADRKRGVGKAMMTWAAEYMHQKGLHVGNLQAAHETFYRRYGWECCGAPVRIICPVSLFPGFELKPVLPVRLLSLDDWPQLSGAYEKFAYSYSGMAIRKSFRWSFAIFSSGPLYVFAAGDPVEAYAVMRLGSANVGGEQVVSEFVWATPEGYESLLDAFAGVGINRHTMNWTEPFNGPFMSKYLTRGVQTELNKTQLRHPGMYRAFNVPSSLATLPASGEDTFTLAIDDEILPANRGPWRVSYSPEGVEVEPSDTAEVQMDIRQFVQALMGEPSFSDLLLHSLVSCGSAEAAQAAAMLLSPKTTHILEAF